MSLRRRTLLGAAGLSTAALAGCGRSAAAPVWAEPSTAPAATTAARAAAPGAPPAPAPLTKAPPYAARVQNVLTKYLKPTPKIPNTPGTPEPWRS